ncbi:MAG: Asp-tRNA(Asn)/Glu-tRNA(Gln) amidotransferase subunit GatC [Phycisphaerales bacterium]
MSRTVPDPEVTADEVRRLAQLARLAPDEASVERLRADLSAVLSFAGCLMRADLDGVEPMTRACEEINKLADDEPGDPLPIEAVERLAPAFEDGFIPVPKVLDGGGGA